MESRDIDKLEECQKTVEQLEQQKEQLEEENGHLRQAAGAFGQLAERLSTELREQRRQPGGNRLVSPGTGDRRSRGVVRTSDDER